MTFNAFRLRRACWIALLAMLALALAPTLSHALTAARGAAAWVDICTAQGTLRVVANEPGAGQELPRSAAAQLEHCAYCSLATHAPALPPAPAAWLSMPPAGAARPAARQHAPPHTPLAWPSGQPRAPPAQL